MKLRTYKAGIKDLPFVLLTIDLIWWVLSLLKSHSFIYWAIPFQGLYFLLVIPTIEINILKYWWIGELFSHSVAFVAFMAFYAYIHKYCLYSWVCIGTLGLLNITNILHYFCNFGYVSFYAGLIIITGLTFAIIKWKTLYYKNF